MRRIRNLLRARLDDLATLAMPDVVNVAKEFNGRVYESPEVFYTLGGRPREEVQRGGFGQGSDISWGSSVYPSSLVCGITTCYDRHPAQRIPRAQQEVHRRL